MSLESGHEDVALSALGAPVSDPQPASAQFADTEDSGPGTQRGCREDVVRAENEEHGGRAEKRRQGRDRPCTKLPNPRPARSPGQPCVAPDANS